MKKLILTAFIVCSQIQAMQMGTANTSKKMNAKQNSCPQTCCNAAKTCCYLTAVCGLMTSALPVSGQKTVAEQLQQHQGTTDLKDIVWQATQYEQTIDEYVACKKVFSTQDDDMQNREQLRERNEQRETCNCQMRERYRKECYTLFSERRERAREWDRLIDMELRFGDAAFSSERARLYARADHAYACYRLFQDELEEWIEKEKRQ
jgi:hypothetical protein